MSDVNGIIRLFTFSHDPLKQMKEPFSKESSIVFGLSKKAKMGMMPLFSRKRSKSKNDISLEVRYSTIQFN